MSTTVWVTLEAVVCPHGRCGIVFGLSATHMKNLRESHETFYCPNGHQQSFRGRTEAERLAAELKAERELHERTQKYLRDEAERAERRAARSERRRAAAKGVLTRTRNRIAAGVCPCCQRTFENLQNHMRTQHADYVTLEPEEHS